MRIEPFVCLFDQPSVKTSFAKTRFITGHKQDGLPSGIKGKSNLPHAVTGLKAKLFHVGVARPIQGVYPRASESRTQCIEKLRLGK